MYLIVSESGKVQQQTTAPTSSQIEELGDGINAIVQWDGSTNFQHINRDSTWTNVRTQEPGSTD